MATVEKKILSIAQNYMALGGSLISSIGCLAITSNPCISILYCSGVISMASFLLRGHRNEPLYNLLYTRRKPSPSQMSPLILSDFLPQKTDRVQEKM